MVTCSSAKRAGGVLRTPSKTTAHGRHIVALIIGAFAAIWPDLINRGYFHVAIPPYYGVTPPKAPEKKRFYLRGERDWYAWLSHRILQQQLSVEVGWTHEDGTLGMSPALNPDRYTDLVLLIMRIGDLIDNAAKELVQPPLIVERLIYACPYLEKGHVDTAAIQAITGTDRAHYDARHHVLTLSLLANDYIIPLHKLVERLNRDVIPALTQIDRGWRQTRFFVTTRNTKVYKRHEVSFFQLYLLFQQFAREYTVLPFKGLGGMTPRDKFITCMNPDTRTIYRVTDVGDVDTVFNLLGRDSQARKDLLL